MVWGAVQGKVEGNLQTQRAGLCDEGVEVSKGPQLGCDGIVATMARTDRIRGPRIQRPGHRRVVRALAVDGADRVDRGQVDDVEAHVRDGRQALRRGHQGP